MPKGGATSLIPVQAGLQEDLDAFLKAYLRTSSHRFIDYKRLFLSRGILSIFNGRYDSAEIIEFNEHLLVGCLPYMQENICPGTPRSLQERLFGLYSLYTFFYLQQVNHVVKIRMDPDAVRTFCDFSLFLHEEKIMDAFQCCVNLRNDKAFKFVAFVQIHDPSCFKRFDFGEKPKGVQMLANPNDPLSNVKGLLDSNMFIKMNLMHMEYMRVKEKWGVETLGTIGLISPHDLIKNVIETCERNIVVEQEAKRVIPLRRSGGVSSRRSKIRERAYNSDLNFARFRRHRAVIPLEVVHEKFEYSKREQSHPNIPCDVDFEEETSVNKSLPMEGKPKRGPGRPRKEPEIPKVDHRKLDKVQKTKNVRCDELRKTVNKKRVSPVPEKPSGRKTNNSIASELFDFAGSKKEIISDEEEIGIEEKLAFPESDDELMDHNEVLKSDKAQRFGVKRRVSFRRNSFGDDDLSVYSITPRKSPQTNLFNNEIDEPEPISLETKNELASEYAEKSEDEDEINNNEIPEPAGIEQFFEKPLRQKSSDSKVIVEKRVKTEQPVVQPILAEPTRMEVDFAPLEEEEKKEETEDDFDMAFTFDEND